MRIQDQGRELIDSVLYGVEETICLVKWQIPFICLLGFEFPVNVCSFAKNKYDVHL